MTKLDTIIIPRRRVSANIWAGLIKDLGIKDADLPFVEVVVGSNTHRRLKQNDPTFCAPHEQRVHAEYKETLDRLRLLENFIATGSIFPRLESIDQDLLLEQRMVMTQYVNVLKKRIDRF